MAINTTLAAEQKVTETEAVAIDCLTAHLRSILLRPWLYTATPLEAVEVVKGIEFALQTLWHFPTTSDRHRYTWDIHGCCCPRHDNIRALGTGMCVIENRCWIHNPLKNVLLWEDLPDNLQRI